MHSPFQGFGFPYLKKNNFIQLLSTLHAHHARVHVMVFTTTTHLVVVLREALVVGRNWRDEFGTGVRKHVLKHLLLALLKPSYLVLKPLLQLRVHSLVHVLDKKIFGTQMRLTVTDWKDFLNVVRLGDVRKAYKIYSAS